MNKQMQVAVASNVLVVYFVSLVIFASTTVLELKQWQSVGYGLVVCNHFLYFELEVW